MIDREFARLAAASGRRELGVSQQKLRFPAYTHVWMKYVLNVANGGHIYRSSKAGVEAELLKYDGIMTAQVVPFNKHQLSVASPRHYDITGRRFETEKGIKTKYKSQAAILFLSRVVSKGRKFRG